ncbi:MAG: alanine racemase [Planctomycetota bacterium]
MDQTAADPAIRNVDRFQALTTPCLLLDVTKLDANLQRMHTRLAGTGVTLRPHVKTAKSVDVARRIFPASNGIGPITVSTLREAEYFADAGFRDILYAVSIVPAKVNRVARIQLETSAIVHVILDDQGMVPAINDAATQAGCQLSVLAEIDCDGHRAGIPASDEGSIVDLSKQIDASESLKFSGIMTHAGESYGCASVDAIRQAAELERLSIERASSRIASAGIECPIRSVGSSPTGLCGGVLTGVSELRAGVFVFQDLFQSNLGTCTIDQIAVSVLATVISHRRDKGWILVDAGGMALSKDRGTASQSKDYGFGLVCDTNGNPFGDYLVDFANQEHGIITNHQGVTDLDRFPIGSQLRILPNHACMTSAAYDCYHAIDGDAIKIWPRVNGW